MEYQEVPLESLLLDTLNPRHDPVESQREALRVLLDDKGAPQLLRLAEDLAEYGPSPIELALVVPDGKVFIVVEGNRRIAAMKLLKNPRLADGTKIAKQVYDLSRRSVTLDYMACIVAPSRDDARRWIELRHNGAQQGVGVVGWSPEMQVRFTQNFSGQRGRALLLTDELQKAYKDDRELLELIQQVVAAKVTTLGRLVSDPDFRKTAGIEIDQNGIRSSFAPSAARAFWHRLLADLSGGLTVSTLKSKDQRAAYLGKLADVTPPAEERRPSARLADDAPPQAAPSIDAASTAPAKRTTKTQRARPLKLFDGLTLRNVKPKVKEVLREAQRLDIQQFPNAGAMLVRVVVELVVDEAADHYGLKVDDKLGERIRGCLAELDPSNKAHRYAAMRKAVSSADSLFSVRTMQAYVHNPYLHADAASVRALSDNYAPFLEDLDAVIGSSPTP